MYRKRYYYLIHLQFLGFRYSGWQKQPGQKTIEGMLTKTLKFVLPNMEYKLLGAGRTDAKVSALETAFELFVEEEPLSDIANFLFELNKNLPPDIRAITCEQVDEKFNIIQDPKLKEYVYLFSFGTKNHPFCAPFLTNIQDELDIELMQKAALLFSGNHDFRAYTAKPKTDKTTIRTIDSCAIVENDIINANFFPSKSYALKIKGKGFIRYQIRMIMGALIQLGRGELGLSDIQKSLQKGNKIQLSFVAPGSGLILNKIHFE